MEAYHKGLCTIECQQIPARLIDRGGSQGLLHVIRLAMMRN